MGSLRRVWLVFSLLIVGVLGAWMVPVPSEALPPTLTLDGATINVNATAGQNCTVRSGFLACFDVALPLPPTAPLEVNNKWIVFDCAASTNPCGPDFHGPAKVDVRDVAAGSTGTSDNLGLEGIGFKAKFPSAAGVTGDLILEYVFSANNQATPKFLWGNIVSGYIDPPPTPFAETVPSTNFVYPATTANVYGDSVIYTAEARTPDLANTFLFSLGGFTKSSFTNTSPETPVSFGINETTATDRAPAAGCNTGSNKCTVRVRKKFHVTLKGSEVFVLDQTLGGSGGPCSDNPKGNQTACSIVLQNANSILGQLITSHGHVASAIGAIPAQLCQGSCIVLRGDGTPPSSAEDQEFGFTTTGLDLPPTFTLKLDQQVSGELGTGVMTFSGLTNPGGSRTFTITSFPGNFEMDTPNCTPLPCTTIYEAGNSKTKIGFVVPPLTPDIADEAVEQVIMHFH